MSAIRLLTHRQASFNFVFNAKLSQYKRYLCSSAKTTSASTTDSKDDNESSFERSKSKEFEEELAKSKISGFAEAFDLHEEAIKKASAPKPVKNESFASLLRHSKFIDVSGISYHR